MIEEDPDALGYWIGEKPVNPWDAVSSLIVCNSIMSPAEQEMIVLAAVNAENGHSIGAEEMRKEAGYGRLWGRDDADGPEVFL